MNTSICIQYQFKTAKLSQEGILSITFTQVIETEIFLRKIQFTKLQSNICLFLPISRDPETEKIWESPWSGLTLKNDYEFITRAFDTRKAGKVRLVRKHIAAVHTVKFAKEMKKESEELFAQSEVTSIQVYVGRLCCRRHHVRWLEDLSPSSGSVDEIPLLANITMFTQRFDGFAKDEGNWKWKWSRYSY